MENENRPPLISIVLPTYNGVEAGLSASLASCVAQTYKNFELIVVNDGSTDETEELVREWMAKDSRIRLLNHATNKNLPNALNTGFAAATGDFLTWTSDDNRYWPEALQKMLDILQDKPDVAMVYCDYQREVAAKNCDYTDGSICSVREQRDLIRDSAGVGACFLYRQEVYQLLGDYNPEYFKAEDYEYWLRVSENFTMQPIHEVFYTYRFSAASMTGQGATKVWDVANWRLRSQYAKSWRFYSNHEKASFYSTAAFNYRRALRKSKATQETSQEDGPEEKLHTQIQPISDILLQAVKIAPFSFSTYYSFFRNLIKPLRRWLFRCSFRRNKKVFCVFGIYLVNR